MAKKYSADRSYEFVNGILDRICKENKLNKSAGDGPQNTRKNVKIADQESEIS